MRGSEQGRLPQAIARQRRQNRRRGVLLWLLLGLMVLGLAYLLWRRGQGSVPVAPTAGQPVSGFAEVHDGDTLTIRGVKVRLYGVDAPEAAQTCTRAGKAYGCGREAAFALADLTKNKTVTCTRQDTDRYGRMVGLCRVGNTDVNAWMVANGYALAYREYSTRYVPQENAARQARRGLHAGKYVEPWNYRKGQTTPAPAAPAIRQPYPTCAAARAAGKTPVLRGEAGYNPELDGDHDGKMCE